VELLHKASREQKEPRGPERALLISKLDDPAGVRRRAFNVSPRFHVGYPLDLCYISRRPSISLYSGSWVGLVWLLSKKQVTFGS